MAERAGPLHERIRDVGNVVQEYVCKVDKTFEPGNGKSSLLRSPGDQCSHRPGQYTVIY